jgi:AraC family transcriptional regulator of adaptative response / DNA-3-methyladenine glycosylase II
MYERLLASDPLYDGVFFTGVLTTGIYCLPSCKARKPKSENVRFFGNVEDARAAGLRPCRKCHPDDYARGADPVLESIETLVEEMRADPAAFPDVRTVVQRSGFGSTRLFELFRIHFHATPAELLLRARIEAAKRALAADAAPLTEVALSAGFESLSVFHEQFRLRQGLTPGAWRDLAAARSVRTLSIALPPDFALPEARRALARDRDSASERTEPDGTFVAAVRIDGAPVVVRLRLEDASAHVETGAGVAGAALHAWLAHLLGLEQDAGGFARLARRLGLQRLVAGRPGLRILQTNTIFDGLLWSILGQQITVGFAATLRRRLTERFGPDAGDGLRCTPDAAALASIAPAELAPLQFSTSKAAYVVGLAREIAEGRLDLERLARASATRVERTLRAVRGLGPWSVNYVMMRSLGFADCTPIGDTGLTSGLQRLFLLEQRPDADATRRLVSPFSPYRSLATAHLWLFERPTP